MAEQLFALNLTQNTPNIVSHNLSTSEDVTHVRPALSPGLKVIFGIIIASGIIIGTAGNILVPITVYFNKNMRTVMYVFIINLSIADFLITAVFMPILFGFYITTYPTWPYHPNVCKLTGYLVHMTALSSAVSLLAISYHRYFGIVHAMKGDIITIKTAKIISILIWMFSGSLMLPSAIMHQTTTEIINGVLVKSCEEVWPSKFLSDAYLVFRISCYFIFTLQIVILYTKITCFINSREIPGIRNTIKRQQHVLRRRKVTRVLFIAACAYILCWILYMLNKLFIVVWEDYVPSGVFPVIGYFMGMLNSSINPCIYLLGEQYRTAVKKLLRIKSTAKRGETYIDKKQEILKERSNDSPNLIKYYEKNVDANG